MDPQTPTTQDSTGIDHDQRHGDDAKPQRLGDYVDQRIADDPLWSQLTTVTDETLYGFDPSQSDFHDAIDRHVMQALTHLNRAQRIRAAEVTHEVVRESGGHWVEALTDGGGD